LCKDHQWTTTTNPITRKSGDWLWPPELPVQTPGPGFHRECG
jgi:hypothetical protein